MLVLLKINCKKNQEKNDRSNRRSNGSRDQSKATNEWFKHTHAHKNELKVVYRLNRT